MTKDVRPRILCVDDEQNVLEGLTRTLRSLYSVETALGGAQGLEVLKANGPFAVVISDLRMPGMSGVELLSAARQVAPDSVRVLLTGYADLHDTIAAVNDGNIFRFLTKPCPSDALIKALAACAEQYRLVTAERVLLQETLHGSIKALTNILALSNPAGFSRATRVQQSVSQLMAHFKIAETWPIEVAAMLSQIGYVTLPLKTQEKLYKGEPLTADEQVMYERVPQVTEKLLASIPRLEVVREILRLHTRRYAGEKDKDTAPDVIGETISWGARALKICVDFDVVMSSSGANHPFDILRSRIGWYDPVILEAFAELQGRRQREVTVYEVPLREVTVGMVFGEDVRSAKGLLLIAFGQDVTPSVLERIHNFSPALGIREPIRMLVRQAAAPPLRPILVAK
jgi:response regulator RpfG family c-di-GMP phosphodiesterase